MIRPALLLFGALAAAIVARAAWGYGSDDPVATGLVVLVGAAFSVGYLEQWRRLAHAQAQARALAGLPRPATEALFDAPPAPWAAALAAVRAGRGLPAIEGGATPYLLGMLIMMGILGTFLGLVQTMSGARSLLHDAATTESLRAGLAVPLSGLGRAFGTSVAGVGTSMCLGLSALLVRQASGRIRAGFSAYAASELAAFSPLGRQLHLLATIAQQGGALPEAAGSLGQVTERLAHLEVALAERQAVALERIGQTAQQAATQAVEAVAGSARDVGGRFSTELATALDRLESTAGRLAGAASTAAAEAVGSHLGQLKGTLRDHATERAQAERSHLDRVGEALANTVRQLGAVEQARADDLHHALAHHRAHLDAEARRATEAEEARVGRLRLEAQALLGRLEALAVAQREAEAELLTRVGEAAGDQAAVLKTQSLELLAAIERLGAQTGEAVGSQADTLKAQGTDLIEEIRHLGQRLDAADAARLAALRAEETAAQARHVSMAERLAGLEGERLARLEATQLQLLERLATQEDAREAAWQAVLARLDDAAQVQTAVTREELATARSAWSEWAAVAQARHVHMAEHLAGLESERLARLEATQAQLLERLATQEAARETAWQAVMARLDDAALAQTAVTREELAAARTAWSDLATALAHSEAQRVGHLETEFSAVVQGLSGLRDGLAAGERARADALRNDFAALLDAVRVAETRQVASERDRIALAQAQVNALSAAAAEGVTALQAPMQVIVDRLEGAVVTLAAAERERADALNDRLDSVVGQVQAITSRLEHAEQARVAAFAAAVDRLRAAAELAAVGTTEHGAASVAVIGRLDALVGRLGTDAEGQTRRIAAGEAASQARLAALAETFERTLVTQAERLAALEGRLAVAQDEAGRALGDRLGQHAEQLGERLAATGSVVREAADLLKGGGAELSAVAEMFAGAVDAYRETSERSLAALARLEDTLGRSGGDGGAARLIGEYLDQTREIFGDAVRFQRELFTELRAAFPSRPGERRLED